MPACPVGKQNSISAKEGVRYLPTGQAGTLAKTILNPEAQTCLKKLYSVMSANHYAARSIGNYTREMRLLFSYYNDWDPKSIKTHDFM